MWMWLGALLGGCSGAPPADEAPASNKPAHALLDTKDPAACESCHASIVAEWRESMHARAHPDHDPVYAAMRKLRMEKQGAEIGQKCQKCHNPQAPDDPDSPAGRAGVACGACHTLAKEDEGATADGRTLCMTCHDALKNPAGVATCTTGPENADMGGPPCTSCHMPKAADGHAEHRFPGPHRAWYQDDASLLKQALAVTLERTEGGVRVVATNTAGHAFPTGFPGRVAMIRLEGEGPKGWWTSEPVDALVFKRVYLGEDGKPTLPPFAASQGSDSRLEPGGRREAVIPVPAGVAEIGAELVFRLVPPPGVEALGLTGTPEAEPVVVSLVTLAE